MSETPKTLIFLAAAAVIGLLAWFLRPAPLADEKLALGAKLVAEGDPTAADALEIVRFEKDADTPARLKVQRDGDQWVIASHNDYPADAKDAEERIRDVALQLMDTEILGLASEVATDHAQLGVIDPTSEQAKDAGEKEVGLLVRLEDGGGGKLANVVIGNQVKGSDAQRFIRRAGESEVYFAQIDIDKLSSKFEDWIEPNLLDVNSSAVKGVTIKDYNFDIVLGRTPDGRVGYNLDYDPRMEVKVDYNSTDSSWKVAELLEARGQRLTPSQLTEDEELNKEKLDDLKRAIDDLKIINVESKPKELVAGAKSEQDLINDAKIMPLLSEKGYFPVNKGGEVELLSSNGEVRVQTDDGIEYILRFGRTAGVEEGEDEAKLNRYLLVSARVNEAHFQPQAPETTPMTEAPAEPPAGAGGQEGEPGEAGTAGEETPPDASAEPDAEPAEPAADEAGEEEPPTTPPGSDDADKSTQEEKDESAQKRKEADEKVKKLNEKFAKWYYIISEDVYKKLHLGRFDVIREKGDSSFGLDELERLPSNLPNTTPPSTDNLPDDSAPPSGEPESSSN